MRRFGAILAVLVLAALTSVTLAKKGGGGGKPGGGDPPDYSVAYVTGTAGGRLCVMNADGSATKQLTRFSVSNHLAWHADGDKVLAYSNDLSPAGIYTVDLDGGSTLVLPLAAGGFHGVAMSNVPTPTGGLLIAYVAPGSAGNSLFVCEPDGSNSVALLSISDWLGDNAGAFDRPTFHPSGGGIALLVQDYDAPNHVIFVELGVDSEGQPIATNVTRLTGLAGTALENGGVDKPTFSNSGDTLAVFGGDPRSLWFVDMADLASVTNVTTCTNIGAWDASDSLFYYTQGGFSKPPRYRIHTIDASGTITDLGIGGHHVKCRMP